MIRIIYLVTFILPHLITAAQEFKSVLFIGNSYTYTNNLPLVLSQVASSLGDSVYFDSNTPAGHTLQQHSTNATTMQKIGSSHWDLVILQEQSQLPAFPPEQVQIEVYPYADSLNKRIKANDTCTKVLLYMTWGRKNGDAA